MENYITRQEHDEFVKRMEDEHERTNHRLKSVETSSKEMLDLTISVKELAISMRQMTETQKEQGERLSVLESRDGENWRTVVKYVITALIGAAISFIFTQI